MGNGEWGIGNYELRITNYEWGMGNREMGNRKKKVSLSRFALISCSKMAVRRPAP